MGLYSLGFGVAAGALAQVFPEFADTCQQFRPNGAANPTDPANQIGTVTALFDTAPDFKFRTPSQFGKPQWYGLFDFSATQAGDYLVGVKGTWFVAAIEAIHPPLCIRCNGALSFYRPTGGEPGPAFYGSNRSGTGTPLMTNWPASLLKGTKGERGDDPMAGDTRNPWMEALLPASPGVILRTDDIVLDDQQRRFVVSGAELTALGWRMELMFAGT